MKTVVVTIAHGRHEHLRRQLDGLAQSRTSPNQHVVVAMSDPAIRGVAGRRARVTDHAVGAEGELPLAAARNTGADTALAAGADVVVFLDVDCIPSKELVGYYEAAAARDENAILCGPVAYLPPPDAGGYDLDRLVELAQPHGARPNPAPGLVEIAADRRLFWSLSFAVTSATWKRIGGFDPAYVGYGGEDTDFAERAHSAGVGMRWVGGAIAFHQHHSVSTPPVEHLDAIVRNARTFHRRWGWWPMTGWLDAFARLGLAAFDPVLGWRVCETAT